MRSNRYRSSRDIPFCNQQPWKRFQARCKGEKERFLFRRHFSVRTCSLFPFRFKLKMEWARFFVWIEQNLFVWYFHGNRKMTRLDRTRCFTRTLCKIWKWSKMWWSRCTRGRYRIRSNGNLILLLVWTRLLLNNLSLLGILPITTWLRHLFPWPPAMNFFYNLPQFLWVLYV